MKFVSPSGVDNNTWVEFCTSEKISYYELNQIWINRPKNFYKHPSSLLESQNTQTVTYIKESNWIPLGKGEISFTLAVDNEGNVLHHIYYRNLNNVELTETLKQKEEFGILIYAYDRRQINRS